MSLCLPNKKQQLDWHSLHLLLMLSLPALFMAVVLLVWPDVTWQADDLHTVIVLLGSLGAVLLSVFTVARFRNKTGIEYLSSGLLAAGVFGGFQSISPPGSSIYIWLHVCSGFFSGILFILYLFNQSKPINLTKQENRNNKTGWIVIGTVVLVFLFGLVSIIFNKSLPLMVEGDRPTHLAWILNAFPLALYLFAAVYLFTRYRVTGNSELFLYTAILIFLFQASEVFYFARLWSIVWWFWLTLRLAVYLSVLIYVLKEYIQTSNNLAAEISRRNATESALREADRNWRDSFNSLEDAMLIVDSNYNITNFNRATSNYIDDDNPEIKNQKCYTALFGKNQPCEPCPFRTMLVSRRTTSIERSDARTGRHYSVKTVPILANDGNIEKFVYLMSDITERVTSEEKEKLLQRELSQRSRLASIGEVVAGVTHEINNPLTSIIAFAQLLEKSAIPENMREAVAVINESTNRVAEIVDKLHTFSRRQRPEKEYADINPIISGVLQMRSYELRKHNIEVLIDLDRLLPRTMFNVGQMQQVLLNIVVNAEQAMSQARKSGIMMVSSSKANGFIKISISDNGSGIKEENMEKLFTPFFTTKDADGGPGLGLGLSISYGIVKEHGGRIYARSYPGNGTTFTIELPVVANPEQEYEQMEQATEGDKHMGGSRVLVIDDEVHIRRALERVIAGEGHEVVSTASAQNALETLHEQDFDLIILDIKMPGMDGITFFEQLVSLKPAYREKVLCMTGDLVSSRNKDFIKNEKIPYLIKPFGISEFLEQVKNAFRSDTNA